MDKIVTVNQKAPTFVVRDVYGATINLNDYEEGYTLLVFLRYSGCPWCNLAIHRLSLEYKRLAKERCQVVAFVQSDKKDIIDNIYNRHQPTPPFPVIPDHQMKVYRRYGVDISLKGSLGFIKHIPFWLKSVYKDGFKQKKVDGNLFLVPAWFLVNNKTGMVVRSERGVSFYEHTTFTSIYEALTFKD